MTSFSIRIAGTADDAMVSEVLRRSYTALMPDGYEAETLQVALPLMVKANPVLLRSGTYYLAETDDGIAVGCGGWTAERPGSGEITPGLGHIRHFATHPDWLGRGVGKMIFDHCADVARVSGITEFECYSSLNAEKFYAALGFVRVKKMEVPMGPTARFPSIVMRKTLS